MLSVRYAAFGGVEVASRARAGDQTALASPSTLRRLAVRWQYAGSTLAVRWQYAGRAQGWFAMLWRG